MNPWKETKKEGELLMKHQSAANLQKQLDTLNEVFDLFFPNPFLLLVAPHAVPFRFVISTVICVPFSVHYAALHFPLFVSCPFVPFDSLS